MFHSNYRTHMPSQQMCNQVTIKRSCWANHHVTKCHNCHWISFGQFHHFDHFAKNKVTKLMDGESSTDCLMFSFLTVLLVCWDSLAYWLLLICLKHWLQSVQIVFHRYSISNGISWLSRSIKFSTSCLSWIVSYEKCRKYLFLLAIPQFWTCFSFQANYLHHCKLYYVQLQFSPFSQLK